MTGSLSDEDQVGNLNLHPSTFTETITDKVGPRDPGAFSLRYKAQLDDVDPPPPGDDDSDNDGDDEGDNEEVENPTDED